MAFQPAPGVIGVTIEGRDVQQMTINTLSFFQNGADPTVGDCQAINNLISSWYITEMLPLLCDVLTMLRVTSKNLYVNGGARATLSMAGNQGGVATEQAPNLVSAVVSWDTGQSGKSSHGRNYIPALPNSAIDTNNLDPAFITAVVAAYSELLPGGAFDAAPYYWSVLSRVSGGIVMANAIAVPVQNVYFTDDVVDSQRRRGPGRGR